MSAPGRKQKIYWITGVTDRPKVNLFYCEGSFSSDLPCNDWTVVNGVAAAGLGVPGTGAHCGQIGFPAWCTGGTQCPHLLHTTESCLVRISSSRSPVSIVSAHKSARSQQFLHRLHWGLQCSKLQARTGNCKQQWKWNLILISQIIIFSFHHRNF